MKIIAELYISKNGESPAYLYDQGEPDAFVEADDFETAEREINRYILTMADDDDRCTVCYRKEKQDGDLESSRTC